MDEALESNFEKHDKIAKIHNGRDVNGGLLAARFALLLFH